MCLTTLRSEAASLEPVRSAPTRQQLIGAWRLVAVEYRGPRGETADPFFQAGSFGLIIYDASGWMSVQISAPNRRSWGVPDVRVPQAAGDDRLKAEAFDTYYSYYGTWDFDAPSSVVTHHLSSSVIPAETGLNYAQRVDLEGGRLVFTVRAGNPGAEMVRRKIWEKLSPVPRP
jgi:hypothetical protein